MSVHSQPAKQGHKGLSDGQRAKIVYLDDSRVTNLPVVQTLKDEFIDLNRRTDLKVDALLTANEV